MLTPPLAPSPVVRIGSELSGGRGRAAGRARPGRVLGCVGRRSYGLRGKTRVWKSGRNVAETRTISVFWVYMTYRDLIMAALSCW